MSLNKSSIDYLEHSEEILGRPGRSLNIVTGCKHHESDICNIPCYARRMVEHGRLKGNKAFPYGFEPTVHLERIRHYQNRDKTPMLIFLNTLGDVGGDWKWKSVTGARGIPKAVAKAMVRFANLNPEHIILLLTKNPKWYGLQEWPDNVWCGFMATNNKEYGQRWYDIKQTGVKRNRMWLSAEPWLNHQEPDRSAQDYIDWIVVGGQSNPNHKISDPTVCWIQSYCNRSQARLFVKENTGLINRTMEYPAEWNVK